MSYLGRRQIRKCSCWRAVYSRAASGSPFGRDKIKSLPSWTEAARCRPASVPVFMFIPWTAVLARPGPVGPPRGTERGQEAAFRARPGGAELPDWCAGRSPEEGVSPLNRPPLSSPIWRVYPKSCQDFGNKPGRRLLECRCYEPPFHPEGMFLGLLKVVDIRLSRSRW